MAASSSTTAGNASGDLVADLNNGKPILTQLITAAATGDENAIENAQTKNGYNITSEGVSKLLLAADPGPAFDIRMVAGLYTFQAPPNLTSKQMRIDPLLGRLFIDELWVGNSTDANGNVEFNYNEYSYSLVFSVTYNESGVPNPFTVSGTRQPMGSTSGSSTETVKATQLVPQPPRPPAQDWTSNPGWAEAGMIIGVFGGGIPFLLMLVKGAKDKIKETNAARKEELTKNLNEMIEISKQVQERIAQSASAVALLSVEDSDFNISDFQNSVEDAIQAQVNADMTLLPDIDTVSDAEMESIKEKAASKVKDTLRESYLSTEGGDILRRFGTFNDVLDADARRSAIDKVADARLGGNKIFTDPKSLSWVTDTVNKYVAKAQSDAAVERATESRAALTQAQRDKAAAQAESQQLAKERAAYKAAQDALPPEDRAADYAAHLAEMQSQIDRLDNKAQKADQAATDHAAELSKDEARQQDRDEAQKQAEDDATKHAGEAFPGPAE